MDLALCGLIYECCLVYLDDIIAFARDFDTHLRRLHDVFDRLRAAKLRLHINKCFLFQCSVEFFGHVLSESGVELQAAKVEAVQHWPVPSNLMELRAFLGLCSYYRRFIEEFAIIVARLYELQSKNVRFEWTQHQDNAFDQLKSNVSANLGHAERRLYVLQ